MWGGCTADLVNIFHDIFATGFEIGQERNLIAYLLKIIQSQVKTNGPAKGTHQQAQ